MSRKIKKYHVITKTVFQICLYALEIGVFCGGFTFASIMLLKTENTITTIEIMEMMVSMARENHQTRVIVTHDVEIAAYADKIYHIIDGIISSVEDNRHNQISVGSQEAADIIAAAESV